MRKTLLSLLALFFISKMIAAQNPLLPLDLEKLRQDFNCSKVLELIDAKSSAAPPNIYRNLERAACYEQEGKAEDALKEIESLVNHSDLEKEPLLYRHADSLLFILKRNDLSTSYAKRMVDAGKLGTEPLLILSRNLALEGEYLESLKYFERAHETEPLSEIPKNIIGLQIVLERSKNDANALDHYRFAFTFLDRISKRLYSESAEGVKGADPKTNDGWSRIVGARIKEGKTVDAYSTLQRSVLRAWIGYCDERGMTECRDEVLAKMITVRRLSVSYLQRSEYFKANGRIVEMESDLKTAYALGREEADAARGTVISKQ